MNVAIADRDSNPVKATEVNDPVASLPNVVACPKLPKSSSRYRFYPGFSHRFVTDVLSHWPKDALVLDPWNGSGTTTTTAAQMGLRAVGIDLNPAMVVLAKGRLIDNTSLATLDSSLLSTTEPTHPPQSVSSEDPLLEWFDRPTVSRFRSLLTTLIGIPHVPSKQVNQLSSTEAYWLTCLFRVLTQVTKQWHTTNPTWIKSRGHLPPITLNWTEMLALLKDTANTPQPAPTPDPSTLRISLGDSRNLTNLGIAPDLTIGSPPYCTRIDYAIATRLELSLLGMTSTQQDKLRRQLMGTTTVPSSPPIANLHSPTASTTLSSISQHPSKASRTYYAKWFTQYLRDYTLSLLQLSSITLPHGTIALVVQDSYYKDIHIDLASITTETLHFSGWNLSRSFDFTGTRSMRHIHPHSSDYPGRVAPTERALFFQART